MYCGLQTYAGFCLSSDFETMRICTLQAENTLPNHQSL